MEDYNAEIIELIAEFNRKLREIKFVSDFEGYYVEVAGKKYSSGAEIADLSNFLLDLFNSLACAKKGVEHLQSELRKMLQAGVR